MHSVVYYCMIISEGNFSKDDIIGENIVTYYISFCYSFDMILLHLFSNKSILCMFFDMFVLLQRESNGMTFTA